MNTRYNSSHRRERGCPEIGDNMVRGLLSLQVCTNCCWLADSPGFKGSMCQSTPRVKALGEEEEQGAQEALSAPSPTPG